MIKDVAVVILAGGEGSRIGGDKPCRTLLGERLIDRALRQARHWASSVAVAVRTASQVQPLDAVIVTDEPDVEGPLGGLVGALRWAEANGALFVLTIPSDMPFLPVDLLERLSDAIGTGSCALASSGGHVHPVCALWRTAALSDVSRYVETGRRSLKGFAELVGCETVEWRAEPFDPFFNINTADDLARAEGLG